MCTRVFIFLFSSSKTYVVEKKRTYEYVYLFFPPHPSFIVNKNELNRVFISWTCLRDAILFTITGKPFYSQCQQHV